MYYIREDEEQRYGRDKSTIVNQSYIEGGEYRRKFDELTKSPKLNRLIYNMAKKMLFHRSGTKFEDMCWIDMETEKVICCKFNEHKTQTIQMTETISKKLSKYNQIIPIHTHPSSLPPSPADFNCMLQSGYIFGIVLCHDGTIFTYSSYRKIDSSLWNTYVEKFLQRGINMYDAQIAALNKFEDSGDIEYEEVKANEI